MQLPPTVVNSYRIRLPTEKELEMKVSKEVKKMRFYESTLLSVYKVCPVLFLIIAITKFGPVDFSCLSLNICCFTMIYSDLFS